MDMEKRWMKLWPNADPAQIEHSFVAIRNLYTGRPYHNLDHIAECLGQLDAVKVSFDTYPVEVALWYHDVIYDPKRKDNEQWSAEFAINDMRDLDAPHSLRRGVTELIMATKHDKVLDSPQEQLIVDIDLHTLGRSWEEYQAYSNAIRREYAWVTEDDYVKGRAAVLQTFLDRPQIYYTDHFRQLYEEPARRNLAAEIVSLNQGD